MTVGRKPKGPRMAMELEGSRDAKRRLQVILETITGECTVGEACKKLDVSEAHFFRLRTGVLQAALADLEPKPMGRPRLFSEEQQQHVNNLTDQIEDLRFQLQAACIREQIALAMPALAEPTRAKKKSKPRRR